SDIKSIILMGARDSATATNRASADSAIERTGDEKVPILEASLKALISHTCIANSLPHVKSLLSFGGNAMARTGPSLALQRFNMLSNEIFHIQIIPSSPPEITVLSW